MNTFSDKLKENIRFELMAWGSLPTTFQAYLRAAIAMEQNQVACYGAQRKERRSLHKQIQFTIALDG